jgi:hypothetical protein
MLKNTAISEFLQKETNNDKIDPLGDEASPADVELRGNFLEGSFTTTGFDRSAG